MTPTATGSLRAVLDDLVAREVLSDDQARAVLDAMSAAAPTPGVTVTPEPEPAPTPTVAPEPAPAVRSLLVARLIEAGAYLGAALVAASGVAFVLQSWNDLTDLTRLAVLLVLGGLAAGAGVVVIVLSGGRDGLRDQTRAARRRLAGTLLTLGGVLVGVGLGQLAPVPLDTGPRQVSWQLIIGGVVTCLVVLVAQRWAPSAVTELALFGSSLLVLVQLAGYASPTDYPYREWTGDTAPPRLWWEFVVPAVLVAFGLLWASLVARWLTLPLLATFVGAGTAFVGGLSMFDEAQRGVSLAVLLALALIGIGMFVLSRAWPWLALTVAATTATVFLAVLGTGGAVTAFLLSGLVLLGGAGLAAWLGRRSRGHLPPAAPAA